MQSVRHKTKELEKNLLCPFLLSASTDRVFQSEFHYEKKETSTIKPIQHLWRYSRDILPGTLAVGTSPSGAVGDQHIGAGG